jgi:ribosome-binding factor A
MTHRTKRVGELIRRELSTLLEKGYSFGGKLITIHAVDVAPDMHNATVYVGVMGGHEGSHADVIEKLKSNRGYIQRDLYKRVILRSSPLLSFRLDKSAERGVRILNAIDNLPPESPQAEPPPDGFYPAEALSSDEGEADEPFEDEEIDDEADDEGIDIDADEETDASPSK